MKRLAVPFTATPRALIGAILLTWTLLLPTPAFAQHARISGNLCPNVLNEGVGLTRYCRSRNIYADSNAATRAVIVIHGSDRNAVDYYNTTLDALESHLGEGPSEAVDVFSVQFLTQSDRTAYGLSNSYHTWSDSGNRWANSGNWKHGDESTNTGMSSFQVIDHMIGQILDHRPNVEHIVVAGQSAGGMFVSRYATGTPSEELVEATGRTISYWSANPQSYMFPTDWRPESTSGCSRFNDYRVGTDNRNVYMNGLSSGALYFNAITRRIYWTVGENDTGGGGGCEEFTQGAHRVERFENYTSLMKDTCAAMEWFWGSGSCNGPLEMDRRTVKIGGAGHGHTDSWMSWRGRRILAEWR